MQITFFFFIIISFEICKILFIVVSFIYFVFGIGNGRGVGFELENCMIDIHLQHDKGFLCEI